MYPKTSSQVEKMSSDEIIEYAQELVSHGARAINSRMLAKMEVWAKMPNSARMLRNKLAQIEMTRWQFAGSERVNRTIADCAYRENISLDEAAELVKRRGW